MYVVIEKDTGKIVWAAAAFASYSVACAARKFAHDNPGKTYYAAYLYLEVVTGGTIEKTEWVVDK